MIDEEVIGGSSEAKRRLRRSKDAERRAGKWLLQHNGADPKMSPGNGIISTTGRIGQNTQMMADLWSRDYIGEVKNIIVWAQLWGFWKKIVDRSIEYGKEPVLIIDPNNDDQFVRGKKVPVLHILAESRHAELLNYERLYRDKQDEARQVSTGSVRPYSKEQQVARGRGKGKTK